jgi:hypothetical protein
MPLSIKSSRSQALHHPLGLTNSWKSGFPPTAFQYLIQLRRLEVACLSLSIRFRNISTSLSFSTHRPKHFSFLRIVIILRHSDLANVISRQIF